MTPFDAAITAIDSIMTLALFALVLIGASYLSMPILYLFARRREANVPQGLPEAALPQVLIQLPVFNEAIVVAGLLDAVAALDWPRDKLRVQLLDDSTDHHAVAVACSKVEEMRRGGLYVDHIRRSHRRGFKAEALSEGLARSEAPFVAVLDADFRPPPDWLRATLPRLMASPRAGFIQSRCEFVNANTNWLTRVQGLLFDAHFIMEQHVRAHWDMLVQFNGTGAIWRRSAIEAAGGWSGDSLCEDLDLTVRAALAGWRGIFALDPVVPGLVPNRIEHWRVQQRRWAVGFAQIARKLMALIWASDWSWAAKISAAFLILYQAFFPIVAVAAVCLLVDLVLHGRDILFIGSLIAIAVALGMIVAVSMTLPPYLVLRRGGIGRYLLALVTLPPLLIYLALSNAEPMIAAFFGRNENFHRTPKEEASPT